MKGHLEKRGHTIVQQTVKDIKEIKKSLEEIKGTLKFITNLIQPQTMYDYYPQEYIQGCTCGTSGPCPIHGG